MKKILLPFLILTNSLSAQTIDDYLSPPFPTELNTASGGKTIAWVFNDKGSRNIYVAEAPAFNAKKITNYQGDDGIDMSGLEFTPDGNRIIFVRGNANNNSGEPANPAFLQTSTSRNIWIINTDGSGLRKIVAGSYFKISPDGKTMAYTSGGQVWTTSLTDTAGKTEKLFQSRGLQSQLRWSPDGSMLAFVSGRNDHSFVGIYHFTTKSVGYVEASMDRDVYPAWSADGKQLAYTRIPNMQNVIPFVPVRENNPWSIRVLDITTGKTREVWKADKGRGSFLFADLPTEENLLWWTAGGQLVFPWEKDGWQHLYSLNVDEGKVRLLTPGDGEVENVTVSEDGRFIYYTTNITDINRRHIWKLSFPEGKTEQVTKGAEIEWRPVIIDGGLAIFRSSATRPAWPAIVQNGVIKDIAKDHFPKIFPSTLVQPQLIAIKATDGNQAYGDLFLPPDHKPGKKHPAIIFLHGGSRRQMLLGFHYSLYYSNYYALNQYFANQGYVVLALNFRSGIGYGFEFREALNAAAAGASEVKDVVGAGLYLKNRTDVDANKIALYGASYGGYLTAHGLAQASNLFACGVDIHGVHNWNTEIPTFAPWYDHAKFPAIAKKAFESSPEYYVKGWKNPVLMIHGDDDRNVPFNESVKMIELLRKQGVHVEQMVLPDEVHSFLLYRNWVKTLTSTFEFIDRQFSKKY